VGIALREGRRRHHGRVHVLGLSRHERDLVAELAVRRVVQRIGDERAGEIERIRVDRTRIVHARDHHRGCVPGRIRWVDLPRRVIQAIEESPLVAIGAGNLISIEILEGERKVGDGKLLPGQSVTVFLIIAYSG